MAGHWVWSCAETQKLALGMVIALDYFNLPRDQDPRAPRADGKKVAMRATDWGVEWTKFLNRKNVRRWNNPIGHAPIPNDPKKINKTHIRNAHVVDMDQVYRRIWHLTRPRRRRTHNAIPGALIAGPGFLNWVMSVRTAQGAGGGALTVAETTEIMNSPLVANYVYPAGIGALAADAQLLRARLLLHRLPEFLCQLGSATTQYSFL
ncbi:hypothetical protein KVR01_008052 [Diaporthe batatas]|uniref:uncharacterized protein n=1 Tax=Diaporthe batatas TaxID=748121 RepID=UPI001D0586ED|nr:uncharacterized protein KVR01_008052 [Diaporthe batatas]KAG8162287.1 hypothetical protein KVR01_008052 [Diaporthe batatas]